MNILLIDNGSSYVMKVRELLEPHHIQVVSRVVLGSHDVEGIDLVVLSGSHALEVNAHDWEYAAEIEIIKNFSRPIIGICLGFELIAHVFGAKLARIAATQKGILEIQAVQPHPVFLGLSHLRVYEHHRWVVQELPVTLKGIARSEDGYEVIEHVERPIFGFQFHPEMCVDIASGDEIFKNCLASIEADMRDDE